MTPDSLARYIPKLLDSLHPPTPDFSPRDPGGFCRWLNAREEAQKEGLQEAESPPPLGPLWPQLPRFATNHYTLADAPRPGHLFIADCGPIQTVTAVGVNPQKQPLPTLERCQRVGDHLIAHNGEIAFARTDATIPGPLPFYWQRFYRHTDNEDIGLGTGWRHSLSEQLLIEDGEVQLTTAEGRRLRFRLPAVGHSCFNRFERLLLHRQSLHSYRISGFDHPHRIFRADGANSAMPLSEIRDEFGNSLTIDYRDGLPHKIVSSWGRVLDFHSTDGHLQALVNPQAPDERKDLCQYKYEAQFLREARSGLNGEIYQYCEQGLSEINSNASGQLRFEYDSQQRCHRFLHNRLEHTLSWRGAQRQCTLRSEGRHPCQWQFSEAGQVLCEKQGGREIKFLYDYYGNLCQITDAGGQRSIYRYDELGRLTRYTRLASHTRTGINSRYLYDEHGFLLAAQDGGKKTWHYQYGECGLPEKITDPEGNHWRCEYSERGQLLQLTDPEGGKTQLDWDSQGQLQSVQRGERKWRFEYNHWHQLTALRSDDKEEDLWQYGATGELREARIGRHSYRVIYNDWGRPCALVDGEDRKLQWQQDKAGNYTGLDFADGRHWQLRYDTHGALIELAGDFDTSERRCKLEWHYDLFGRLHSQKIDDRLLQWHYTEDGRVREYRDGDAHWYLRYTPEGLPQQIRNNSGQQCEFHYDGQRRLLQANSTHASVRFQYDRRDRLTAEHHDSKGSENFSLRHQYDSRGWLRGSSSDDLDLNYLWAPNAELYGLDANGEAVLRCENTGGTLLHTQGKTRTRISRGGHTLSLESGDKQSWSLDQPAPLNLSAPPLFQRPQSEEIDLDPRDNVSRELRRERQREYHYQYDGWGLLTSAECGDFKTWFRYDPFGRRLSKLSTHRKSTRQRRILTHWYGLGLWGESVLLNGKPQSQTHYLHHPQSQTLLCRRRGDSTEHYTTDPAGRPLALTDSAGETLWKADERSENYPDARGPWRGKGILADSETGLWYSHRGYWNPLMHYWLNGMSTGCRPLSAGDSEKPVESQPLEPRGELEKA